MKNADLFCKYLSYFFKIMCYLLPIIMLFLCFNLGLAFNFGFFRDILSIQNIRSLSAFSFYDKGIIFLIQSLPTVVTILICYQLGQLFMRYSKGEYFELNSINAIKKIGVLMLLGELVSPLYQSLMSYYLTRYNVEGHHLISVSLGSNFIETILTALIVFICAHVVSTARQLQLDNALTI